MWCCVSLSLIVSTSAINCLERLVSWGTHYVSSVTLNVMHSLCKNACNTFECHMRASNTFANKFWCSWAKSAKWTSMILGHRKLCLVTNIHCTDTLYKFSIPRAWIMGVWSHDPWKYIRGWVAVCFGPPKSASFRLSIQIFIHKLSRSGILSTKICIY